MLASALLAVSLAREPSMVDPSQKGCGFPVWEGAVEGGALV